LSVLQTIVTVLGIVVAVLGAIGGPMGCFCYGSGYASAPAAQRI
jgi:hypothetical protein